MGKQGPSGRLNLGWVALLALAAALVTLGGCATAGASNSAQKPTSGLAAAGVIPTTAAGAPARPGEAPLRPFADVIKDAKQIKGAFTLWQRDDKLWIEIRPEQLDQPFLFSTVLSRGLAQMPFVAGLMGNSEMASFHRVGNQVQLIAHNTMFRTAPRSPLARAADTSVSDSILASSPVVSAAQTERKSFLVEANGLLLGDIAALGTVIDAAFRTGFALDRANSSIERARGSSDETLIAVRLHYAVAKLPAPPATASTAPAPTPPRAVPDPRSFLLGVQYRFVMLPDPPMPMRLADERIGYFVEDFRDLTRAYTAESRVRVIDRWRLEKKDLAATVSEPRQPIVAMLDRNIPVELRGAVTEGVLEWNMAFEQAGFSNAIVVRQQPDDADWDTLEGRHIAIRWFVDSGTAGTAAIGPRLTDPRTGEILYGAALIPDLWARIGGSHFTEVLPPRAQAQDGVIHGHGEQDCSYAFDAAEQAAFSYSVLSERGSFASPAAADDFIRHSIKAVVVHEFGHALGLRHNFIASHALKSDKLDDPGYTQAKGLSASIMDYVPENIPLDADKTVGRLQMDTIGTYDRWAIEWGYRSFEPAQEGAELERIAARSATDPMLAFATDEDAGIDGVQISANSGIDPRVNRFDLGDDELAFYRRQALLTRELWTRTERRQLMIDDDFRLYRRNLERGLRQLREITPNVAKFVGGVYVNRVRAGAGTPLFTLVEPARQRAALQLLTTELFSPASFRFAPFFMQRLGVDQYARGKSGGGLSPDFSLPAAVLGVQRPVLDQLMSDLLAQRMADAESKSPSPRELLGFADVQAALTSAVWQDLRAPQEIGSLRRNLQREHLRRLAGALIKPLPTVGTDVRSVFRMEAEQLQAQLQAALTAYGTRNDVVRAHLAECLQTLREALTAPIYKTGV